MDIIGNPSNKPNIPPKFPPITTATNTHMPGSPTEFPTTFG